MKIASMEDSSPRGTIIGRQISGPPLSEASISNVARCAAAMSTCAIGFGLKNISNRRRIRYAIGCSNLFSALFR
jgi:hypothetical protein